jgi:transposase
VKREIIIQRARKLREEGWGYQRIADRYKVSVATAYRYSNPESLERKRENDARYRDKNRDRRRKQDRESRLRTRPNCPRCGNPMAHRSVLCEGCRADEVDRRARQIEKWWAEGLPIWEIAEELGWSEVHAGVEIVRLREKGYKLPYRRAVHTTRSGEPKHPEQVAA